METFGKNSEERTNILSAKVDQIKSKIDDSDAQLQTNYELRQKVIKMEKTLSQKIQESLYAVGENLSKVVFCNLLCCIVLYCVV